MGTRGLAAPENETQTETGRMTIEEKEFCAMHPTKRVDYLCGMILMEIGMGQWQRGIDRAYQLVRTAVLQDEIKRRQATQEEQSDE